VTKRIDPARADFVVSSLRASNPQRNTARHRMSPDQVEAFLLQVMERTEMVQDISTRRDMDEAPHRGARHMSPWMGFAAGFALAALIAIPVLIFTGSSTDTVADDMALQGLSTQQAALVSDVVAAINGEDFDDFRSLFAADGEVGFETGLHRPYHEGVEGGQPIPVTDAAGFEADFAWGAVLDRRISIRDCESQGERIFGCEIDFALEALRLGGLETMRIALDESGGISLLSTEPTPGDGPQPLNISDLSGFNAWLEETHPDEYRRLVRPGTPGSINGVEIQLTLSPMNPDLVPEMTALIDEYLADG
jgi:hypothetical protein